MEFILSCMFFVGHVKIQPRLLSGLAGVFTPCQRHSGLKISRNRLATKHSKLEYEVCTNNWFTILFRCSSVKSRVAWTRTTYALCSRSLAGCTRSTCSGIRSPGPAKVSSITTITYFL